MQGTTSLLLGGALNAGLLLGSGTVMIEEEETKFAMLRGSTPVYFPIFSLSLSLSLSLLFWQTCHSLLLLCSRSRAHHQS